MLAHIYRWLLSSSNYFRLCSRRAIIVNIKIIRCQWQRSQEHFTKISLWNFLSGESGWLHNKMSRKNRKFYYILYSAIFERNINVLRSRSVWVGWGVMNNQVHERHFWFNKINKIFVWMFSVVLATWELAFLISSAHILVLVYHIILYNITVCTISVCASDTSFEGREYNNNVPF